MWKTLLVQSATGVANSSMIQSAGCRTASAASSPRHASPAASRATTGIDSTRLIQKRRRMSASIAAAMRGSHMSWPAWRHAGVFRVLHGACLGRVGAVPELRRVRVIVRRDGRVRHRHRAAIAAALARELSELLDRRLARRALRRALCRLPRRRGRWRRADVRAGAVQRAQRTRHSSVVRSGPSASRCRARVSAVSIDGACAMGQHRCADWVRR